ncbi:MAG TPA: hypothetical protein VFP84_21205 [Kofleriaceae bacterium]|nr:hypothetical protein [Kofleriaceae bacterium]
MAGIDEPSARAALAAMQDRLARDPSAALGVGASPTPDEVRSAFLELTKLFHPVRFGRMAPDIQKLSNEVFLALRAAHDTITKSVGRRSGATPIVAPAARPPGAPVAPAARPSAIVPSAVRASAAGTGSSPVPPAARPATAPGFAMPRTITPTTPSKAPTTVRTIGQPAATPPARPPVGSSVRQSGAHPIAQPAAAVSESSVLDLLQRGQWDQARTALHQLLARDPNSRRVRALMAYARGREAQLDRRLDDARVELHDALDLDPSLELAKTALTELFTRRR